MFRCAFLTSVFWPSAAFPSYRHHVPNGLRVACPPGVQGCRTGDTSLGEPSSVCDGLGHATCAGADFPLNPFGQALKDADFKWTQALCNADSDGDGFSNGEELGDPCCSWKEGDGPSPYMSAMSATHPGFATASLPSDYSKPACTAATQPDFKSPGMAAFNPGEEQRYVDFIIKNYSIPEKRTDYSDFVFNFDDTDHSIFHIVYGIALVNQPKLLHHFVVTGCSQKIAPELQGQRLPGGQPEYCNVPVGGFAGWAPGAILWDMPTYAGVPMGTGVNIVAFNINVHFTDGDIHKGSVSQDGIRIYYTPTLRNTTVDSISIMSIGGHRNMVVPPKKERYFVTRTCHVQSDREFPIVATYYHAHLLGAAMYQTLTRNNQTWDLGSQSRWHYDDQAIFPMMAAKMTVRHGDVIQGTCIFNSMSRDQDTPMGRNTVDEMCFTQVNTERPTSIEGGFKCEGDIWAGELGANDDPRKIAQQHPLSNAEDAWYGSEDGHALGRVGDGEECELCKDPNNFLPDKLAWSVPGRGDYTCGQVVDFVRQGVTQCSQVAGLSSICCSQSCKLCSIAPGLTLNETKLGYRDNSTGTDYTCKQMYDYYEVSGAGAAGCDAINYGMLHCCEGDRSALQCKICGDPGQKLNEKRIGYHDNSTGTDYTCKELHDHYMRTGGADVGGCDTAKRYMMHCCDTDSEHQASCGASWSGYVLAASGSANCDGCGSAILTFDECMEAAAEGASSLGIRTLQFEEHWDGPPGCHIQDGANFQFNSNMAGAARNGHTSVCRKGSKNASQEQVLGGDSSQGEGEWPLAQCQTSVGQLATTCPKTMALAMICQSTPTTCQTPENTAAATTEFCDVSSACRKFAEDFLRGCEKADMPSMDLILAGLPTMRALCVATEETSEKDNDVSEASGSTTVVTSTASTRIEASSSTTSAAASSSTTSAGAVQDVADGSVNLARIGSAALAFAVLTLLVA